MGGPDIVELARAAVRRLSSAAPVAAEARQALARIEQVGLGPPYTVAIAGEVAARTELLNWLAGGQLFDAERPERDRIVVTLRRGAATSLLARRRDGSLEERTLEAESPGDASLKDAPGEPGATAMPAYRKAPRARRAAVDDILKYRAAALSPSEAQTRVMPRPPPWWAIWRWVARWWQAWRARRGTLALPAMAATTVVTSASATPIPVRRGFANTVARGKRPADARKQFVDARNQFVDALQACLADVAVERLFVDVAGGPLPDKLVVIELPSRANARSLDAVGADCCLIACGEGGFAMTEQIETALTILPHVFVLGGREIVADHPRVRRLSFATGDAAALTEIARIERAIAAGTNAVTALASGSAALDAAITRAEIGFRARLDRLEAMRIADPDAQVAAALARIRPAVVEHVRQLLRRSLDGVDDAITELGAAWSVRLGEATTTEALRTIAAQIDEESPAVLQSVQATAHRALVGGLTERARSHYQELIGELRRGTPRDDAAPPWLAAEVEIAEMTSSTSLGAVAPRLSSLFRAFDALKLEALTQLEQRVAKLRQVATANVLDTEPRLEPAVTGTLGIALRGEIELHMAWLDAELARERIAIDTERAELAALATARDTARTDERELVRTLDALAAELP